MGNGEKAALKLWKEAGVRVMPGNYLARNDKNNENPGTAFIRIALVQKPEFIQEALIRLKETIIKVNDL